MTKRIAIIGTVPISKHVAPYDDASWEIWVCSPGNSQAGAPKRIDKWFELHALVDMRGQENASWCPAYFAWLRAQPFPIFMQEPNEDVPQAQTFPRDVLVKRWGQTKGRTNWFTSSIAWMIAYAIHVGATEIGIFGVDMAASEEHYSWQKAGCLRFCEIATELGITITIPLESTLATPAPMYGYAEASRMGRSLIVREHEMKSKIAQIKQQQHQLELEAAFFQGALEDITFVRRTYVSGHEDAEIDDSEARASVDSLADEAARTAGVIAGSTQAMDAYRPTDGGLLVPTAVQRSTQAPTAADFPDSPGAALLKPASERMGANGAAQRGEA